MEEFTRDLYMPVNAPDSDDVIQGIGAHELYIYTVGFFICVLIGLLLNTICHNSVIALFTALGLFSIVVLIFRRDIFNENLIKKIKIIQAFSGSQKIYEYSYFNIYEVRGPEDETEE